MIAWVRRIARNLAERGRKLVKGSREADKGHLVAVEMLRGAVYARGDYIGERAYCHFERRIKLPRKRR